MLTPYLKLPPAVYWLCLGTLINRAGWFVVPFLAVYLQQERKLPIEFATTAMGLAALGSMVGTTLGGHLADKIGRRRTLLMGLVGGAALLMLFSVLRYPPAILVTVFSFAAVGDLYRPAVMAILADTVEPGDRPQAFTLLHTALNLGFTLGMVIGGTLAAYSYQWLIYTDASTSCLYALVALIAIPETLPRLKAGRGNLNRSKDDPAAEENEDAEVGLLTAVRHIVHDRTFLLFCGATMLVGLVVMQSMSTFPLYLGQRGFSATAYSRIILINGIIIVVSQIPITAVVARFDRGWVMAVAMLFVAVGFGATGFAETFWQFGLAVALWSVGELMQSPLFGPIVADLAPVSMRARYMGIASMSFTGGNMIGAPLGGLVLSRLGGAWIWAGCAVLPLIAAGIYLAIGTRLDPMRVVRPRAE